MCLILFGKNAHPEYRLIVAANRDEFYERPTQKAHYWEMKNEMLAGKDLEAGGTWMGITKNGRFSALTNVRDFTKLNNQPKSRGEIPVNYLSENKTPFDFAHDLDSRYDDYNGFNVLLYDVKSENLVHYNNHERIVNRITDGIYGLSNASLDTPWPKVRRGKMMFDQLIEENADETAKLHEELLKMLRHSETAPDDELPDTGVPPDKEKQLSAMCIRMEGYGTRSSAVVTIDHQGRVMFTEHRFGLGKEEEEGQSRFEFEIGGVSN